LDLFTALLAPTIATVCDPPDRRINLVEDAFFATEQPEREFLIGTFAPKLSRVGWYAGGPGVVLQGIIFHLGHDTEELCPQGQESRPMKGQVGVGHVVEPIGKQGNIGVPLILAIDDNTFRVRLL